MKKVMLLILSVGLLGAAQAVTSKWDNWQSVSLTGTGGQANMGWVNGDNVSTYAPNTGFALKVTLSLTEEFSWKSASANGIIFMLKTDSGNPNCYGLQVNHSSHQVLVDD